MNFDEAKVAELLASDESTLMLWKHVFARMCDGGPLTPEEKTAFTYLMRQIESQQKMRFLSGARFDLAEFDAMSGAASYAAGLGKPYVTRNSGEVSEMEKRAASFRFVSNPRKNSTTERYLQRAYKKHGANMKTKASPDDIASAQLLNWCKKQGANMKTKHIADRILGLLLRRDQQRGENVKTKPQGSPKDES
jgi:hypothetical protein